MSSDTNPNKQSSIEEMYHHEFDTPIEERSRWGCLIGIILALGTWALVIWLLVRLFC